MSYDHTHADNRELVLFSRAGLRMTSSSPRLKPQNATEWCFGEDICYPDNAPVMMETSHMYLGENVEDSAKSIDTSLVAQGAYNVGVAVDAMNPAFEPMSMFPESHTLSSIPFTGSMHWVTGMPSDGPYQAPLVAPDMSLLPAQFLAGPSHLEPQVTQNMTQSFLMNGYGHHLPFPMNQTRPYVFDQSGNWVLSPFSVSPASSPPGSWPPSGYASPTHEGSYVPEQFFDVHTGYELPFAPAFPSLAGPSYVPQFAIDPYSQPQPPFLHSTYWDPPVMAMAEDHASRTPEAQPVQLPFDDSPFSSPLPSRTPSPKPDTNKKTNAQARTTRSMTASKVRAAKKSNKKHSTRVRSRPPVIVRPLPRPTMQVHTQNRRSWHWEFDQGPTRLFPKRSQPTTVQIWAHQFDRNKVHYWDGVPFQIPPNVPVCNMPMWILINIVREQGGDEQRCHMDGCTASGGRQNWLKHHLQSYSHMSVVLVCLLCGFSAREDNMGQRHGHVGCSKKRNSNHKRHPLWEALTTEQLENLLRENEEQVGKYQCEIEEGETSDEEDQECESEDEDEDV